MKPHVIFLDVDGVLNSVESSFKFDDKCFEQLGRLVKWFDADLVLSSSWRKIPEDVVMLNNALKEKIGIETIDKTGVDEKHWHRGFEVLMFLDKHPEIKDYIVIDDDSGDIVQYIRKWNFIHTSNMFGLTKENVNNFIQMREYIKDKQ